MSQVSWVATAFPARRVPRVLLLKLHYCTFCSAPEHLFLALLRYFKIQSVPAIALLVAWTENARV